MAWTLDTAHTVVGFSAKHLGLSTVRGQFNAFRGEVDLPDASQLTSARGRAQIDVASIDTGNEQRDAHLKGPDFFDVERYPTITFEASSVKPAGEDRYEVTGELTIRDVTRPVTLTYEHGGVVTDPFGNTKLGGTLTGVINRNDWGLKWNVPLGGGGLLVGEKIKLEIDGQLAETREAVAQEAAAEARV